MGIHSESSRRVSWSESPSDLDNWQMAVSVLSLRPNWSPKNFPPLRSESFRKEMLANAISLLSLAPYERRVIELLRNSKDKRARKLAKKRVRPHQRYCLIPLLQWPSEPHFLVP